MTAPEKLTQRTGELLKGRYRIHQLLHSGAGSTVYAGVDQKSGHVAIKVLEVSRDAAQIRSSYLANAVGHPSAVNVLDTGSTEDGAVFLVMELLEATSLHELMRQHDGRLPVRLACTIADQGLELLTCAHAQGIVHGEIALEKLFFTRTERLKLLGFDKPQAVTPGATPSHASEQACAQDVREMTKAVLWLLYGEPVDAPLSAQALRLPERIASVLERGLSAQAELGWKSANAMRTALQLACQAELGRPVDRALRTLAAKQEPKKSTRSIWFAAAGALLVGLYVVRDLAPGPQPSAAAEPVQSDLAAASEAASEPRPADEASAKPAEAGESIAPVRPAVYTAPPSSARVTSAERPATPSARVVPRKPAIPELRMPVQRRAGLAANITSVSPVCAQLRAARRTRALSDSESQVWLAQCTKR